MHTTDFSIKLPHLFDFEASIRSHGWYMLPPNLWVKDENYFSRVDRTVGNKIFEFNIKQNDISKGKMLVHLNSNDPLSNSEIMAVEKSIIRIFRLDENFTDFYKICKKKGGHWSEIAKGKGRLMRSSTIFEDLIKTICTTNTNWLRTISMIKKLVNYYGDEFSDGKNAFPSVESIASSSIKELKSRIGLGYRASYVYRIAEEIISGKINIDNLNNPKIESDQLYKELINIYGIGPYSAATMMMLLGRYDRIALDSEMIKFTSEKYFNGQKPTNREIDGVYQEWGKWKYLGYWYDKPIAKTKAENSMPGIHFDF